jgi:hypothetical protein
MVYAGQYQRNPLYAFLGLVAEASIHACYGHPTVLTDLIIASPAAMPRDGTHLSKSLESIVHPAQA